jgi:hypothetical protein
MRNYIGDFLRKHYLDGLGDTNSGKGVYTALVCYALGA